jgi:hypothetical protein
MWFLIINDSMAHVDFFLCNHEKKIIIKSVTAIVFLYKCFYSVQIYGFDPAHIFLPISDLTTKLFPHLLITIIVIHSEMIVLYLTLKNNLQQRNFVMP